MKVGATPTSGATSGASSEVERTVWDRKAEIAKFSLLTSLLSIKVMHSVEARENTVQYRELTPASLSS